QRFTESVIRPALKAPQGEARIRAIVEGWINWPKVTHVPGGCIFVAAAFELDDRPGPARDQLVRLQKDWIATLARSARIAVEEGQFRPDLDPEQFAFELYGYMLVYQHANRLIEDPTAERRINQAFEDLLLRCRA